MRSALALALLVVSLGLVAAGCGGDDNGETVAADEWADAFCSATQDWGEELQRIGEGVRDLGSLSSDTIADAGEEAEAATQSYVDELRELGRPETESGQEIESTLEELADEVETESAEIEDAIEDLSGLTGIATAGREIVASLTAMFTSLERALEALGDADVDGELETALEDSEACDELTS